LTVQSTRARNVPARNAHNPGVGAQLRVRVRLALRVGLMTLAATAYLVRLEHANAADLPERLTFQSADGKTMLTGYVFKPAAMPEGRVPAVVMMHGRGGAYSTLARGIYDASTLSQQHQMWGRLWAEHGYIALLVDGFGPRGYPQGFSLGSYKSRPGGLNEVTIRPLDAYGALAYLRSRPDVLANRIGLQGWSNGGSAALAAMSVDAPGINAPTSSTGFRAALVFYPGCGLKGRFDQGYRPYASVRVFQGTADEEVSPRRCRALVENSRALGGDIEIRFFDGATHGFDAPTRRRQSVQDNANAAADALARAQHFFAGQLQGKPER
jgi:dienelactone hydrolase